MIAFTLIAIFRWGGTTGRRLFASVAMVLGLVAGLWILSGVVDSSNVELLEVLAGLGVLYGTYLLFRGSTGVLFRGTRARTGALINLVIGVATLIVPGGAGGYASLLAIASGFLGLIGS